MSITIEDYEFQILFQICEEGKEFFGTRPGLREFKVVRLENGKAQVRLPWENYPPADQIAVEHWLAAGKEAALRIDPETAEVEVMQGQYCAKSPGNEVWLWFGRLPASIRDALWEKHKDKLAPS